MSDMQRSLAAKYAIRPVTRFVRPATQGRMRRMGLRSFGSFIPAPAAATVLRRVDVEPLAGLRSGGRGALPTQPRARSGAPRPSVSIHWAHSARARADRRTTAAATPWRG
jgi:hypothetical protein